VLTVTAIAASGVLVVGGLAMAAIPDAPAVIHGCYARSGGQLEVIDCQGREVSHWLHGA
jgi:hypothetical protein